MKNGKPQAKDIDTAAFLGLVYDINANRNSWAIRQDVEDSFNPRFPEKVMLAKASSLMRKGLLGGCDCGCRGDYTVSRKGCELLGRPWHGVEGY